MSPTAENRLLNAISATRHEVLPPGRPYSWSKEQCSGLLQHIYEAGLPPGHAEPQEAPTHFLGTILVAGGADHCIEPTRWIVDGAQRIATTVLVLMALVRELQDKHGGLITNGREKLSADRLLHDYIYDPWGEGRERYRIIMGGSDALALQSIVDGTQPHDLATDSKLLGAFEHLRGAVSELNDLRRLMRGLKRLEVLMVELPDTRRAAVIFDLVNFGAVRAWNRNEDDADETGQFDD
jgi:uncharacterized protein with ParB-like and HNH nuclease domain